MKNLFRFVMAVAVLFTASCAKEEISTSIAGGEVEVSFTANLADLGTRAEYGTGNYVNTLRYKVFSDGELLNDLCGTIEANDGTKFYSVNLVLIKGMSYDILFWADHDAQYAISNEGVVSFSTEGLNANDETRDAFYYLTEDFDPANANSENTTITLRRPFAQLNAIVPNMTEVGKSMDLDAPGAYIKSTIATTICTSFNPFTGEAGNETPAVVTLGETNVQDFAEGHLSMNYLLAPGHLVDVTFFFEGEKFATNTTINNIPLKANYKTNVIGNLLTGATEFNVSIDANWNTAEHYIYDAFQNGGEVTLTEDIVIAKPLEVAAGKSVVLDLNGHNIINTTESEVFGEGEGIIAYGKLTINGEGTVQGTTMAVWARGNNGAEVTINGGTYKGCAEGFAKGGRSVIYASSGNTINIYGGTFQSLAADVNSYANKTEGVYAALNVADNNGYINVYGGTFYKQNPAAPGTEPAAWNAAHPNGFVAEGYSTIKVDNDFVVVPGTGNGVLVSNVGEFNTANDNAEITLIVMNGGEYGTIVAKSNKTYSCINNAKVDCIALNSASNLTLKNITFDAANAKGSYDGNGKKIGWANIVSGTEGFKTTGDSGSNIVIDGCTFTGTFANGGEAIAFTNQKRSAYGKVTIKNCTFATQGAYYEIYGFYAGMNDLVIENNIFKSQCVALPVYLGRYSSSMPVVVKGNVFETVSSLDKAVYVQDHSNYGVSINAVGNTFAQ